MIYASLCSCVYFSFLFFSPKHDVSQTQNLKVAENIGHLSSSSLVSHQTLTPSATTCLISVHVFLLCLLLPGWQNNTFFGPRRYLQGGQRKGSWGSKREEPSSSKPFHSSCPFGNLRPASYVSIETGPDISLRWVILGFWRSCRWWDRKRQEGVPS